MPSLLSLVSCTPLTALFRWRASHARRFTQGAWQRPATVTGTHLRTDRPQWTVSDSCRLGYGPLAATQRGPARSSRTITTRPRSGVPVTVERAGVVSGHR